MTRPAAAIFRLLIGSLLVTSAAAIGLARLVPEVPPERNPRRPAVVSVNAFFLDAYRRGSLWYDADRGTTVDVPFPDDELLEYGSCSPWSDERGRSQLVGRWSHKLGSDADDSYGLARISYPDGAVLDHIETDVIPVGRPCWYPGTGTRVLFAAGDGKLYQFAFGSDRPEDPRPLSWNGPMPGGGDVYLNDPHWPADPRFSRLVLVALRQTAAGDRRPVVTGSELWWLRLSEDGGAIEEAGRLLDPTPDSGRLDDRCPVLGRGPEGRLVLAFLRHSRALRNELRLAPIEFDPAARRPVPAVGPGEVVADDCLASQPTLSADGRWISAVQEIGHHRGALRRFSTDRAIETALRRSAPASDGGLAGGSP